jgi:hypothetical protein
VNSVHVRTLFFPLTDHCGRRPERERIRLEEREDGYAARPDGAWRAIRCWELLDLVVHAVSSAGSRLDTTGAEIGRRNGEMAIFSGARRSLYRSRDSDESNQKHDKTCYPSLSSLIFGRAMHEGDTFTRGILFAGQTPRAQPSLVDLLSNTDSRE